MYPRLWAAIPEAAFRAGARLHSPRHFAKTFDVSRTSTVPAYEQPLAEGYVESRAGARTYVAPVFIFLLERTQLAAKP